MNLKPLKIYLKLFFFVFISINMIQLTACGVPIQGKKVVVYTSVDQVFSEPVLKQFEKKTGIKVLPVYDVEASKTTGLVNRLIAEKEHPRADVFWNGEFAQTLLLKEKGVLDAYKSANASDLPSKFVDPDGYWTGFGGRTRGLLVNTNLLKPEDYPKSIVDLLYNKYQADKIGLSNPVFSTSATHSASLYALFGREQARDFFDRLHKRGIKVLDGNAVVRDMVADGQLVMGMTDMDDANEAIKAGKPVKMIFLDQENEESTTLVTPNTVALIKQAPHDEEAKKLIDFLLSYENEDALIKANWFDVAVHQKNSGLNKNHDVKSIDVNLNDIYKELEISKKDMAEIFVQ